MPLLAVHTTLRRNLLIILRESVSYLEISSELRGLEPVCLDGDRAVRRGLVYRSAVCGVRRI